MILRKAAIGLFAALLCGSTIAADESQSASANSAPVNKVQATPYQKAIIDAFLYAAVFSNLENGDGGPLSVKFPGLTTTDSKKMSDAYEANEYKADKTFKGKWLWLQGSIKGIRKTTDGPTAMLAPLGESSPSVRVNFENETGIEDKLADLDQGDVVTLICQGVGKEMLFPTLNKCVFFENDLIPELPPIRQQLIEALEGKGNKAENAPMVYEILSTQEALGPDNEKACEKSVLDCLKAIVSVDKSNGKLPIPQSYLELGYTPEMLNK